MDDAVPENDLSSIRMDPSASQTDWGMIHQAVHGDEETATEAWDQLARRYWPAIYAFIRGSGRDVHKASDLTQGFICDVMVDRGLLDVADPARGRFRSLLLSSLKNYLAEQHRYATRQKRLPVGARQLEFSTAELAAAELSSTATPEAAFSQQFSAMIVRRVLDRVKAECTAEQLQTHWSVFEARVVRPMLKGEEPASYSRLVELLDVKDASQAANMMITVKRRFARALYQEVGQTVSDPADIRDEINELMDALERRT
jgi:RNA polymerase sigma-70 factor (ECF subfamily)